MLQLRACNMRLCSTLELLFFCSLALIPRTSAEYDTYYVERDCLSGKLTLSLNASGAGSSALLGVSDARPAYTLSMECRIEVSALHRVVVAIRELGFRTNLDGSCRDYLKIQHPNCERLTHVNEERHHFSEGKSLSMLYHVSSQGLNNATPTGYPGFKITVTAIAEKSECSSDDIFQCVNGMCIWSGLQCDTHNNCGDISDEQECSLPAGSGSTVLIILGVLIVLLLIIMCSVTFLCSKNETVRRFSSRVRSQTLLYLRRF